MSKNYYETLGVQKSASKDEIKKAFRTQAHKYHPDKKGGDEKRFKEASEAYSVLSDEKKRAEYDSYGRVFSGGAPGGGGYGAQGFDGFDFGGVEFDLGDIFGDFFGGGARGVRRGRDISIDIELSFKESIFGVERKILLMKTNACNTCGGSGAKSGSGMEKCTQCNGAGKIREAKRSFLGAVTTVRACEACQGKGQVPKEKCASCHGLGVKRSETEIPLGIPPGINNGEMIRLSGAGEVIQGGASGDLYVKIHVKADPRFIKEGNNLVTELSVKLSDALLGNSYSVPTLEDKVTVKVPSGVRFGEMLRVKGEGVAFSGGRRGDLLIRVKIDLPQKLSKNAEKLIDELRKEGV
jgi:molecular chaperone DnaJ